MPNRAVQFWWYPYWSANGLVKNVERWMDLLEGRHILFVVAVFIMKQMAHQQCSNKILLKQTKDQIYELESSFLIADDLTDK